MQGYITYNNQIFTDDYGKATILNQYFESVFVNDNGLLPDFPMRTCESISDIEISYSIVLNTLKKLKRNAAAGPDGLPPILFKETALNIAHPLAIMFRSFIDLHTLPSEWKLSHITPVFKKGSPVDPSNYRPISLTSCCCKIMESIIAQDLLKFLDVHKLISKNQHGFLKKHSTTTNILECLNDWTVSLTNRRFVMIAYIDFHRAFDSISHIKLIHKLKSYGITGNLLFWLTAFLSSRYQKVRIGSALSECCAVLSGVPQGSVLGPLLFNLYINDLTDFSSPFSNSKLYADDVKIYTEICDPSSFQHLQLYLDHIQIWATDWQLTISESKCSVLQLSVSKSDLRPNFRLFNTPILSVDSVCDLGITIDSNLCFRKHISILVCKAKQRSALIHRCFVSKRISNLIKAFKIYVRPLLECSPQIWSPVNKGLINLIESVQRAFTKRLPGFQNICYADRLVKLQLQSLEHRRLVYDLILCFNIVHGFSALTFSDFFSLPNSTNLRGHSLRLAVPLARNNIRKHFFAVKIVPIWNSLPDSLVTSSTTSLFKSRLAKHNLSSFLILPSYFVSH